MSVNESQFYMWRTLFAISHADNVVSPEEIRFMTEAIEDVPFSEEQKDILKGDIFEGKDIVEMFEKISNGADQAAFFRFATDLVWVDGDYGEEEQAIMLKLKRLHLQSVNVDDLIGNINLELENDDERDFHATKSSSQSQSGSRKDIKNIIYSFRDHFLKDKMGK